MAVMWLKDSPGYQDQLVTFQNQILFWLVVGLGVLLAFAVGDIVYKDTKPAPVPYVVEVNHQGEPVGAVAPVLGTHSISDETVRWWLGEFVTNAFRIDADFYEEKNWMAKAYDVLPPKSQAYKNLTAWYVANKSANDPLILGRKYWQSVMVTRTLLEPKIDPHQLDTYEIDWQTSRHDLNDERPAVVTNWKATMAVIVAKPSETNPLGLYISGFDFAPEAQN